MVGVVKVMVHMSWLCPGVFMMTCMVRRDLESGLPDTGSCEGGREKGERRERVTS